MTLLAARVLYRLSRLVRRIADAPPAVALFAAEVTRDLSLWARSLADALDRASIAKWRQWNGAEARKAARSCERDAIRRVIAGSRGPSAGIPASDRVESSIGRDGRVGSPLYRDR